MMPATIFLRVAYRRIIRDLWLARAVVGPGAFSVARSSAAYMWIRQLVNVFLVQERITMPSAVRVVQDTRRRSSVQAATILIVILGRENG
jgi:hypothetical protein